MVFVNVSIAELANIILVVTAAELAPEDFTVPTTQKELAQEENTSLHLENITALIAPMDIISPPLLVQKQ